MIVKKSEIVNAMKACSPGVARGKSPIKGADVFTFKDGTIYSFNDDISVSIPTTYTELNGSVKAEESLKLFSKLSTPEVEIVPRDSYWRIKSGNTIVKLKLYNEDCLEKIESLDIDNTKMLPIPSNFVTAIQTCALAKNKTKLEGVAINGNLMMGSDFARACFHTLSEKMPSLWLGDDSCRYLKKLNSIAEYAVTQRWAHFKLESGAYFSTRIIPCVTYPFEELGGIYTQFKDREFACNKFPEDLKSAVDRVATITEMYEASPIIEVTFTKDELVLKGKSTAGTITERLPFAESFETDIEACTQMTADFLREASDKSSKFSFTDNSSLVIFGEEYIQITNGMGY